MDPAEARRVARARLGNLDQLRHTLLDLGRKRDRAMSLTQWIDEFRHDVVFALRQMRATPAFTFVAALTLALGIGANSAIFALVDATLLRPLPFRDPDQVVMLTERTESGARSGVSPLNLSDWDAGSPSLTATAGFTNGVGGMVMRGVDGSAETVLRQWVSSGFFEVLGVPPLVGRLFQPADDWVEHESVVLTEAYWRTRFNADPTIVGRDLVLDGESYRVVGVAPAGLPLDREQQHLGAHPRPSRSASCAPPTSCAGSGGSPPARPWIARGPRSRPWPPNWRAPCPRTAAAASRWCRCARRSSAATCA